MYIHIYVHGIFVYIHIHVHRIYVYIHIYVHQFYVYIQHTGTQANTPPPLSHTISVIIGATSMAQLKENVAAFDVTIPEDCAAELEKLYLNYERPYFANVGRMGRNNP